MKTINLKDYYNSEEAANLLGVSMARISQLIIEGRFSAQKISGKVWLIERESLREYAEALKRVKGQNG